MAERGGRRVMIIAGEASGDLHGASLVEAMHRLDPAVSFFGTGGSRMRAAGVEVLVDVADLAVVGLVEVLAHFPTLYRALTRMRRLLWQERPALLILIDYPDFNLRLAKTAKAAGVKVLYYISPQIWAWREQRVYEIARRVDMMAVVFPFEVSFYERAGVPVRFVGHPLVDRVSPSLDRAEAGRRFGLDPARPVLGLLPGSRHGEIRRLLPVILGAARLLGRRLPQLQFVLAQAPTVSRAYLDRHLAGADVAVRVIEDHFYDVLSVCDAAVTASGTATLETALLGVPMVIVYRMSPLTYPIVRRLVKVDCIGLCNIVTGERIVPELIQHEATPERIAEELVPLLTDPQRAAAVKRRLAAVRERLGAKGGPQNVARLALELMPADA